MKLLILFIVSVVLSTPVFAQGLPTFDIKSGEVSNWRLEGSNHLKIEESVLVTRKNIRCIKLNNYWCLKDVGWVGTVGKDSDSHAAFSSGYYSARAAVRNFRTAYLKHARKSALEIMSVYAPSDDCIGSNKAKKADGTCVYGKNDPDVYARSAAKGIAEDIKADLKLFDAQGKATKNLNIFLKNMTIFEIGIPISDPTIAKGICLEDGTCEL